MLPKNVLPFPGWRECAHEKKETRHEAFRGERPVEFDRAGGLGGNAVRLRLLSAAAKLSWGRAAAAGDSGLAWGACGAQPGQFDIEAPVAVTVRPQRTVAPVGSVVVLVAGVQTGDGYLRTNERLEWTMAPGSVGQFLAVEDNGWVDFLLGDFNRPRIVNNAFAIGSTSRESMSLNRGTPCDNLCVLRGQSWITVASGVEGTSHVTVFAPGVVCCDHRMEEAVIERIRPQGPAGPTPMVPAGPTPLAAGGIAPRTAPAGNISVHKTGPASVAVGGTAAYRIEVSNPGDSLVHDVLLADEVPENFTYLSSTPPAEVVGKRLQWRLAVRRGGAADGGVEFPGGPGWQRRQLRRSHGGRRPEGQRLRHHDRPGAGAERSRRRRWPGRDRRRQQGNL